MHCSTVHLFICKENLLMQGPMFYQFLQLGWGYSSHWYMVRKMGNMFLLKAKNISLLQISPSNVDKSHHPGLCFHHVEKIPSRGRCTRVPTTRISGTTSPGKVSTPEFPLKAIIVGHTRWCAVELHCLVIWQAVLAGLILWHKMIILCTTMASQGELLGVPSCD